MKQRTVWWRVPCGVVETWCSVVWWRDVAAWQSRMWLRCCLHSGLRFLRCGHSNLQPPKLSTPAPPQYKCNSSAKEIHFSTETEMQTSISSLQRKKTFADIAIEDCHNEISTNRILDFQILLLWMLVPLRQPQRPHISSNTQNARSLEPGLSEVLLTYFISRTRWSH